MSENSETILERATRINHLIEFDQSVNHKRKLSEVRLLEDEIDSLNEPLKARTLANLANELFFSGDLERARQKAVEALKLAKKLQNPDIDVRLFNIMGNIHSQFGNFAIALDYYHQSLEALDRREKKKGFQSILINNIAIIYNSMGMVEKALHYYSEALTLAQKEFNKKSEYLVSYNIIECLISLGRIDEIRDYLELMKSSMKTKLNMQGLYYLACGKYLLIVQDYKGARDALEKAQLEFESENDVVGINESELEFVKLLSKTEQNQDAYIRGLKTVETSEKLADYNILRTAIKLACDLAEKQGEIEMAFSLYKKLSDYDEKRLKKLYETSVYQLSEKTEIELDERIRQNNLHFFENMRFIHEVSKDISKEQDYDALMRLIINKLVSFTSCDAVVIGMYDANANQIVRRSMYHSGEITSSYDIEVSNKSSLAAWVVRNKREIYTGNTNQLNIEDFEPVNVNFPDLEVPYESVFYVPLINDNEIIGVFSLQKYENNAFNDTELEMIRLFSSYISVAITNAIKSEQMIALNKKLERISRRDGLSGLLNRNALNEDVKEVLLTVKRTQCSVATILCDIDFFKEYNDRYGHLDGDIVIKKISDVIFKKGSLKSPYLYRFGGDEFLMIFPDIDLQTVRNLAQNILNEVSQLRIPHKGVGVDDIVTISVGVALFETQLDTLNEDLILKNADVALYRSKRVGRNQVQIIKF